MNRSLDGVVKGGEDPSFEWCRRREPLGLSNSIFLTGCTFSFGADIQHIRFEFNISNKSILIQNIKKVNSTLDLKKIKFCESAENVPTGVLRGIEAFLKRDSNHHFLYCYITVIYCLL